MDLTLKTTILLFVLSTTTSLAQIDSLSKIETRLDSMINDEFKSIIKYDNNGNKIVVTDYEWHEKLNKYVLHQKEEFRYDDKGNILFKYEYYWDKELKKFVAKSVMNGSKVEYIYDDKGNSVILPIIQPKGIGC